MTFSEFWQLYPRRKKTPAITGRKKAQEKLEAVVKSGEAAWEEIIGGVKAYADCDNVREGYICLPVTWINQCRWEDEYEIPRTPEEILAAKPLSERTLEDWWKILNLDNAFMRDWHPRNWNDEGLGPPPGSKHCMVPDEIMDKCGWRKYGTQGESHERT